MSEHVAELWNISNIPKNISIALITADFNSEYTSKMEEVTQDFLEKNHFREIQTYHVPGAFEIPGMIARLLEEKPFDLIYCFGVVIKWSTDHYDYVCRETSRGIMDMTLKYKTPIIFGILTCDNEKQVEERINDHYAITGLNLLSETLKV